MTSNSESRKRYEGHEAEGIILKATKTIAELKFENDLYKNIIKLCKKYFSIHLADKATPLEFDLENEIKKLLKDI